MVDLKGKDFLKLLDFTSEEIGYLIDLVHTRTSFWEIFTLHLL